MLTTSTGYLVCFNVLMLGVGNLFWVPLMRVVGKRPVYLLALLMFIATNAWSAEAKSFNSLLAARILSGFAAAAADATVPSLVADLFFVHQRGQCMMIFHLALSCGFFLGPLICAWIVQESDWQWTCKFLAIGAGAVFAIGFFTIRETTYLLERSEHHEPEESFPPKRSPLAWLSVSLGYNPKGSFFKTIYNTVVLALYPPISWVGITVGVFVGW